MATTFTGRVLIPGALEGEALVSRQPFNTTASYFTNMFAGNTEDAPCTDANNAELYEKDLAGAIICTPQTVGSTMGAGAIMGMNLPQKVINTIDVEALDELIEKVKAAGGKLVHGPNEVPGVGMHAYCEDSQGILFGMMQAFEAMEE